MSLYNDCKASATTVWTSMCFTSESLRCSGHISTQSSEKWAICQTQKTHKTQEWLSSALEGQTSKIKSELIKVFGLQLWGLFRSREFNRSVFINFILQIRHMNWEKSWILCESASKWPKKSATLWLNCSFTQCTSNRCVILIRCEEPGDRVVLQKCFYKEIIFAVM